MPTGSPDGLPDVGRDAGREPAHRLHSPEVGDGAARGDPQVNDALLSEPRHELGARAHRPQHADPPAESSDPFVTCAGVGGDHAARHDATGAQHPRHLGDRRSGRGEAVQPGEGDDQVDRPVVQRQRRRRRPGRGTTWSATPRLRAAASVLVEHRLRDVGGEVGHALPWAQATKSDTAAARYVEHYRARRQPADLGHGVVQQRQVAAHDQPPAEAAEPRVLDRPVVDAGPQRVVRPGADGRPHHSLTRRGPASAASREVRRTRRRARRRSAGPGGRAGSPPARSPWTGRRSAGRAP